MHMYITNVYLLLAHRVENCDSYPHWLMRDVLTFYALFFSLPFVQIYVVMLIINKSNVPIVLLLVLEHLQATWPATSLRQVDLTGGIGLKRLPPAHCHAAVRWLYGRMQTAQGLAQAPTGQPVNATGCPAHHRSMMCGESPQNHDLLSRLRWHSGHGLAWPEFTQSNRATQSRHT